MRLGGLGVRSAVEVALPAFLSSAHASGPTATKVLPELFRHEPYHQLDNAISRWHVETGGDLPIPTACNSQAAWDAPLCTRRFDALLTAANSEKDRARLLAVASEHASDWLQASPIPSLGLKLSDSQLRVACSVRLGSPLCISHICQCGTRVEPDGTHGLSCKRSSGRHSRHGEVNELIKRALGSADVAAIREPPGISRNDGKRPDGVTCFPYRNGRPLVWDFTCSCTLAPSHVQISASSPGKVAERREELKLEKYSDLTHDYEVIPICVETMGTFGPSAQKFFADVGRRIIARSGEKRAASFLRQSIGLAIQRGNALSILGTVPPTMNLDEIYYL